jgi:hypothetical protein
MCTLPRFPKGVFHCPAAFAVAYELFFSHVAPGTLPQLPQGFATKVTLAPTGCEPLSGIGATRWLATRPGFYRVLGDAMGLHDASQATFAGFMPFDAP